MSLLEKLRVAVPSTAVSSWQRAEKRPVFNTNYGRPPVEDSPEFQRIMALPRRPPVDLDGSTRAEALVELMTQRLARPARACTCATRNLPCITRLKPAQAWALYEAPQTNGLIGPIGVGHGKTGLDILMPMVMKDCKLAVLLIPSGLRQQIHNDYLKWREHFEVPSLVLEDGKGYIVKGRPVLHVLAYSRFSRPESTDLLEKLRPDLIIADEGHRWRHPDTAGTGRALRYFVAHPECRLCVWSGTLTAKSIKDYAHLADIALRDGSPLPREFNTVEEWALAIDPSERQADAGVLYELCDRGESLYAGYQRRFKETKGVVATKESPIDASINLFERKAPTMPMKVQVMLDDLREGWVRPDGEELIDILAVSANARQLACGFYYRWKFPRGEPEELILRWFDIRKLWHKELRQRLLARDEHMDSELLLTRAAIRACQDPPYEGDLPLWESQWWEAWRDIKDAVYHETEAVWVDDFLAKDAAAWGLKHRGVIWYEHEAFGRRVAELSGLPLHAGGTGAEERILAEKGNRSIVASIKSHGTGRDGLQRIFREQLVANPPASADTWEQLLGRLHRIGQEADEVDTHVYRHTPEMMDAIDKALLRASYIQGTMGNLQKLLNANVSF